MGKHKVRSRPAPTDPPQPFRGPRYAENEERVSTDETACAICGRGIKRSEERWYAEVVDGGSRFARVDEHADPNSPGYMGCFPVGPSCAKLFPAGYLSEPSVKVQP